MSKRDYSKHPVKPKDTDIEVTLISQGRVSLKEPQNATYYTGDGKVITPSTKRADKYIKALGMKRGEKVFRRPMMKAWQLTYKKTGVRRGRKYEFSHTMNMFSEIEDKAEAERIMRKIWNEKTNFDKPRFRKLKDVAYQEEEFRIVSEFKEGNYEKDYDLGATPRITQKSLIMDDQESDFEKPDDRPKQFRYGVKDFKRVKRDE